MKRQRRKWVTLAVCAALTLHAGCASISERINPGWLSSGVNYYVGTHLDCMGIAGGDLGGKVVCLIDLPFSSVLDTALLPVDAVRYHMRQPTRLAVQSINRQEFLDVFSPNRFRQNCYHYYHGDRDGFSYVSLMECSSPRWVWHRWRVRTSDIGLPRSFAFSGWDNREYFDIFGDIAYLDVTRCRLQESGPLSMVRAVTKFQYQPVSVLGAPTGTWAFVATTLDGMNLRRGYLFAPGFTLDQCRDTVDAHGVQFKCYPYRFGGLADVQVICQYNPENKTAPWLTHWYFFTENR